MGRVEDRVYKCCTTVISHFVDSDEVKKNSELYADEQDMAIAILFSCIIECAEKDIRDFNLDVARGILYCALSEINCVKDTITDADITQCATMLLEIFTKAREELKA